MFSPGITVDARVEDDGSIELAREAGGDSYATWAAADDEDVKQSHCSVGVARLIENGRNG